MKTIVINGVEKGVEIDTLGYSAVVFLANKEVLQMPTVTYSRGIEGVQGILNCRDWVPVVDGMIFNIANTGDA